jgi:hypothetical protein
VITAAHAARFRVIGYFFQVSTRVAVARNKERTGKAQIPLVGIFGAYKRLEPPSRPGGIRRVVCCHDWRRSQFHRQSGF